MTKITAVGVATANLLCKLTVGILSKKAHGQECNGRGQCISIYYIAY